MQEMMLVGGKPPVPTGNIKKFGAGPVRLLAQEAGGLPVSKTAIMACSMKPSERFVFQKEWR